MNTLLEQILLHKKEEVERDKITAPLPALQAALARIDRPRDFTGSLRGAGGVAVIGEIKHASPVKGVLRNEFSPLEIALAFAQGGAGAISVLTDWRYFRGRKEYLALVKEAVGIPVLRKDFIIDAYQIYESRALGADAVLLITSALDDASLKLFLKLAEKLRMDALVEVHDRDELERALAAGAGLIGINNRDLRSFQVNLETTFALAPAVPAGVTLVSESGISCLEQMQRLEAAGVKAVLVGESLMRAPDIPGKIRELQGVPQKPGKGGRERCG